MAERVTVNCIGAKMCQKNEVWVLECTEIIYIIQGCNLTQVRGNKYCVVTKI